MQIERSVKTAYWVAIATLAASGVGFYALVSQFNLYLSKEPVPLRKPLDSIPTRLGRWERIGADTMFTDILIEELGTRSYLDRTYAIDGKPSAGYIHVHVAYYTGTIDAVPHIPERCWAVSGLELTRNSSGTALPIDRAKWRPLAADATSRYFVADLIDPVTAEIESVTMPVGDLVATTIEFQSPTDPQMRQVGGYFFIANGRIESTSYGVRKAAFNLNDRYAYYCKIQLTKSGKVSTEDGSLLEPFVLDAAELLSGLVPEVMKCLPDWPSWEKFNGQAGETPSPSASTSSSSAEVSPVGSDLDDGNMLTHSF